MAATIIYTQILENNSTNLLTNNTSGFNSSQVLNSSIFIAKIMNDFVYQSEIILNGTAPLSSVLVVAKNISEINITTDTTIETIQIPINILQTSTGLSNDITTHGNNAAQSITHFRFFFYGLFLYFFLIF